MAQICHSVTYQLPFSHLSFDWMADIHPVEISQFFRGSESFLGNFTMKFYEILIFRRVG